jgi:16S rRNA processing protein RimM
MNAALVASVLPADAVELGRVLDAWGIKGWVRIQPHSADTEALFASQNWFLQPPEARFARGFSTFSGCVVVRVKALKHHADGVVAQLDGVDDRTAAESLKGCRISLPRSAFPPPAEGEFYWVDLIGLEVVNREGEHLGVVRDLMSTGPTSVLVLEYPEQVDGEEQTAERLIPFVDAYIDKIDASQRRITADWQKDY